MISFSVVIIAVTISFLLALIWLAVINYKTGFVSWKNNSVFNLAIGGIAAVAISGVLEFILIEEKNLLGLNSLASKVFFSESLFFYILVAAFLEEFFKGVVIWWGINKISLDKAKDGMIIGMVVGLSFAVAENGIYFATQIDSFALSEIFNLVIARTIFSSIAHMSFSGIMGFFIAKGLMSGKYAKKILWLISGLFFAVLIHAIFNLAVTIGFFYLLIFAIIIGIIITIFALRNNV